MIVFSHDIFSMQKFGGVSRYFVELASELTASAVPWHLWAGIHKNAFLADALDQEWAQGHITARGLNERIGRTSGGIINEGGFRRFVAARKPAVVHRTYHSTIDLLPKTLPVVETLYDMMDECWGGKKKLTSRPRGILKLKSLRRADRIICISQATLDDLGAQWPELVGKASVIHLGVRPLEGSSEAGVRERPHFLFVGARHGYKNFSVVVDALARARLPDHELVTFGGPAFTEDEHRQIESCGLGVRVHRIGGGDAALKSLYENAAGLLYPSAYEGFGMPLLEAMIHGCPVVAASIPPLREVGGEAALYASPSGQDEWSAAMERIVDHSADRARLVAAGRERVRAFTWRDTAQKHVEIYRALGGGQGTQ